MGRESFSFCGASHVTLSLADHSSFYTFHWILLTHCFLSSTLFSFSEPLDAIGMGATILWKGNNVNLKAFKGNASPNVVNSCTELDFHATYKRRDIYDSKRPNATFRCAALS